MLTSVCADRANLRKDVTLPLDFSLSCKYAPLFLHLHHACWMCAPNHHLKFPSTSSMIFSFPRHFNQLV